MIETTEVPFELRKKLGDYIESLRNEKKLGFNQLAIKANVNAKTLNDIINYKNKKINPYQLQKLSKALNIDYKELYKIVGYLEEDDIVGTSKKAEESNVDLSTGFREIPVYPSISAGLGLEHASCDEIEYIAVPNTKEFRGDVIGIRVNGDSMEYTIENGSIAFIKKGEEVANKKVGAFILNNKALLKRYMCMDESCFLRSDNREYSDIPVGADDDFYIVGKFIGSIDLYGDE